VKDVESERLRLINLPYQRQYVWDDSKASRLIESLLLNVPIPVCYFAENADGSLEVIDGVQRINTIVRFLRGEFTLRGLPVLSELEGLTYEQLAQRDQRRIEHRTIRCIVITEESHPDIKFDVFERLNTGAVKLSAQELRNAIYRGRFNDDLKGLVEDPGFRAALGRLRDPRMEDEELILRFLALAHNIDGYKPPLRQFLNEYMRAHQQEPVDPVLARLFKDTSEAVSQTLGADAFRWFAKDQVKPRSSLNKALFDSVMIAFSRADLQQLMSRPEDVRRLHADLLRDPAFEPMIGRATADRTRMIGRIKAMLDRLASAGFPVEPLHGGPEQLGI
jgi:hypothetical protein